MPTADEYTTPIEDIATHQLDLIASITEDSLHRVIPLSTLETQRYCEQKARFERDIQPDEDDRPDRLIRAEEQHAALAETAADPDSESDLTDLWDSVRENEDLHLLYPPFAHEIVNMVIVGRPTFLRLRNGAPRQLTLVRGVTKERYIDTLFPNEEFLLWCHGTLLDRIGLDVSGLSIRYLKYPQSKFNAVELNTAQLLLSSEEGDDIPVQLNEKSSLHPNIRHHPFEYERDTERGKQLRDYLAFWRDDGEPTGATSWKQCASCRFKKNCNLALSRGESRA